MTTFAIGRQAEAMAADFLKDQGYKVLAQNWRTSWCEIDIVAQKDKVIYFVEIKYRLRSGQGHGLEYITPSKLRQMARAALSWAQVNNWEGDYRLGAIEITGAAFTVTAFLPDLC